MRLHPRRTPRTLRGQLARALVGTVVFTTAGAAVAAMGADGHDVPDQWREGLTHTEQAPARTQRIMERYDCSFTGYGHDATPRSAIVQRPSGRLAAVTFDEGWRAYTSDSGASLVAVCLRQVR